MNLALFSAQEKIYFVVCGNLYRNFFLSYFVNYFYFTAFLFSLHVLLMSAVHCTKRILFLFQLWLYNIPVGGERSLFALFKKNKVRLCNMLHSSATVNLVLLVD